MHSIVPIIIIIIIFMQLFFFVKNFLRMRQFSNIFTGTKYLSALLHPSINILEITPVQLLILVF